MDKGTFLWFTGVPASGKSTIGRGVEKALKERGIRIENLDADEIRANLSPDLGYTAKDRDLNTKRLAFMINFPIPQYMCRFECSASISRKSNGITGMPLEANLWGMPIWASSTKPLYGREKSITANLSGSASSSAMALRPVALISAKQAICCFNALSKARLAALRLRPI